MTQKKLEDDDLKNTVYCYVEWDKNRRTENNRTQQVYSDHPQKLDLRERKTTFTTISKDYRIWIVPHSHHLKGPHVLPVIVCQIPFY